MRNSCCRLLGALALVLAQPVAFAASAPSPEQEAAWEKRTVAAQALQQEGKDLQAEANRRFTQAQTDCHKVFQVNACIHESKLVRNRDLQEGRRQESEGRRQEQAVKKERLADEDARREAEAPQKALDEQRRKQEKATAQAQQEADHAARQEEKADQAVSGKARREAEDAARAKKQAEHAAKVAAKIEKAKAKAAKKAAKASATQSGSAATP